MARPISSPSLARPAASRALKLSRTATVSGASYRAARVSGLSRAASRASTGLMTYRLTRSTSSADSAPERRYTLAERTAGRSPAEMSWTHSLAEAARWSNWPGRYSTANTAQSPWGRWS